MALVTVSVEMPTLGRVHVSPPTSQGAVVIHGVHDTSLVCWSVDAIDTLMNALHTAREQLLDVERTRFVNGAAS